MKFLILILTALLLTACDNGIRTIPFGHIGFQADGSVLYPGDLYEITDNPEIRSFQRRFHVEVPIIRLDGTTSQQETYIASIRVIISGNDVEDYIKAHGPRMYPGNEEIQSHLQELALQNGWIAQEQVTIGGSMGFVPYIRPNTPDSIILHDELLPVL